MTQHITPTDNNQYEIDPASRIEKLPLPMQQRVVELRTALTSVLRLAEAPEAPRVLESAPVKAPTPLDEYRAQKERVEQLSAEETALQLVEKAHQAAKEAA